MAAFRPGSASIQITDSRYNQRKLDFAGLLSFALTIVSFLMLLDFGTWACRLYEVLLVVSAATFLLFGSLFLSIEAYWTTRPMIPLHLLKKASVGLQFVVQILCMYAQPTVRFLEELPDKRRLIESEDGVQHCDVTHQNRECIERTRSITHCSGRQCTWCACWPKNH